jgi:hypothetical protein
LTSGSYGDEYEYLYLLGCFTVVMNAVSSSESSVNIFQTTWRNIPEGSHLLFAVFVYKEL